MDPRAQDILDFWFGPASDPDFGKYREVWFASGAGPEFDAQCRDACLRHLENAKAGEFDNWAEDPRSSLALLVLCDQIPRNVHRGEAGSFATDHIALKLARNIVDHGWDQDMLIMERLFAYLPFEHSENLDDQRRCVALYRAMPETEQKADWIEYATQHMEIVEKFGRFPHRNSILGRNSTPEEIRFLEATGINFGAVKHDET